jgi:hypothetical protein
VLCLQISLALSALCSHSPTDVFDPGVQCEETAQRLPGSYFAKLRHPRSRVTVRRHCISSALLKPDCEPFETLLKPLPVLHCSRCTTGTWRRCGSTTRRAPSAARPTPRSSRSSSVTACWLATT